LEHDPSASARQALRVGHIGGREADFGPMGRSRGDAAVTAGVPDGYERVIHSCGGQRARRYRAAGGGPLELAEVEALIARAEAELATLRRRLGREGRVPDPADPFDPVRCLEIWLAALYAARDGPPCSSGQASSRPD
jgi:hypothetical protein